MRWPIICSRNANDRVGKTLLLKGQHLPQMEDMKNSGDLIREIFFFLDHEPTTAGAGVSVLCVWVWEHVWGFVCVCVCLLSLRAV